MRFLQGLRQEPCGPRCVRPGRAMRHGVTNPPFSCVMSLRTFEILLNPSSSIATCFKVRQARPNVRNLFKARLKIQKHLKKTRPGPNTSQRQCVCAHPYVCFVRVLAWCWYTACVMWFARVHVCVHECAFARECVCVCVRERAGVRICALHACANNGYLRGPQLWESVARLQA